MNLVISSLVVWKLTIMFMRYDGPLDSVKYLRDFVNKIQSALGKKLLNFDCYFCLSTVVALLLSLFFYDGLNILYYGLAMATLAYVPYIVFDEG